MNNARNTTAIATIETAIENYRKEENWDFVQDLKSVVIDLQSDSTIDELVAKYNSHIEYLNRKATPRQLKAAAMWKTTIDIIS